MMCIWQTFCMILIPMVHGLQANLCLWNNHSFIHSINNHGTSLWIWPWLSLEFSRERNTVLALQVQSQASFRGDYSSPTVGWTGYEHGPWGQTNLILVLPLSDHVTLGKLLKPLFASVIWSVKWTSKSPNHMMGTWYVEATIIHNKLIIKNIYLYIIKFLHKHSCQECLN